jgi:hypothetical protein
VAGIDAAFAQAHVAEGETGALSGIQVERLGREGAAEDRIELAVAGAIARARGKRSTGDGEGNGGRAAGRGGESETQQKLLNQFHVHSRSKL